MRGKWTEECSGEMEVGMEKGVEREEGRVECVDGEFQRMRSRAWRVESGAESGEVEWRMKGGEWSVECVECGE